MKAFLVLFLAVIAHASAFDEAGFGRKLNGWHPDGSARYSLDGAIYRTLRPVETIAADGSRIVTVTVIHQPNSWAEVPFDLEVAFAADGSAQSFRIQGKPRGQKVDTGLITRPSAPSAVEGEPAPAFNPVAEMKSMLFDSLEPQLVRAADAKDTRKRDLLARIYGPEPINPAAISTGLRHNLDLILGLRTASK